jgi:hypothetical protein
VEHSIAKESVMLVAVTGDGGIVLVAEIRVHVVPVHELRAWARAREAEGTLIDPKVWAGVHLARTRGALP